MLSNFLFDLIIVAIIVVSAIISAHYGFARTVIEFAGFIAAFVIAATVSKPVTNVIYNRVVEPAVISSVEKAMVKCTEDKSAENEKEASNSGEDLTLTKLNNSEMEKCIDSVYNSLPKIIKNNAEKYGATKNNLLKTINESKDEKINEIADKTTKKIIKPVALSVISMIVSSVIIVVLLFITKIIAKFINNMIADKVFGKVNKALGAVIGVLKGIIISVVFYYVANAVLSFSPNGIWIFTKDMFDHSYLYNAVLSVKNLLSK